MGGWLSQQAHKGVHEPMLECMSRHTTRQQQVFNASLLTCTGVKRTGFSGGLSWGYGPGSGGV